MTRYGKTMTEALAEVQYNSSKLQEATIDMLDHDMTDPDFQKLIKKFRLKAKDLKGDDGTTVTGSVKDIEKMLNTMYGNDWKDMYQQKGQKFVELEQVERESVQEGYSPKQIKMAIGIASDKRYAGGNMSGAVAAIEKIKKGLSDHKQVAAVLKRQNEELEEGKSSTGYELYHKDFSSAMQHAYAFAKKKFGITIDPKEIDDKVASGPKKPSNGKTNSYRLKGNKGNIQVQVANLDNKKYELNMYKEDVQIDEMTAAEKKLIDLMYDKKGNLTPLGKKVMDHGKKEEVELDEGIEKTYVRMMQIKLREVQKAINPTSAIIKKVVAASGKGKEFKQITKSLTDIYDTLTDIDMNIKEEVELDEIKQGWALIDTADGNKVKALSSREQGVKQSKTSAERPPMSVKDKNTLKIIKLKKAVGDKQASRMIGYPLEEEVDLDENKKADLAKKLAKASQASKKGKSKVTLKKAPWDKKEEADKPKVDNRPDSAKDVDAARDDKKKTRIAQLQLQIAKATETINKLNTQEK